MSYLDLLNDISNGDLVCSIFYKRDAFDFDIANFESVCLSIQLYSYCFLSLSCRES